MMLFNNSLPVIYRNYPLQPLQVVTQRDYLNTTQIFNMVRSNFYGNRVINDWKSIPCSIVDSLSVNELLDSHYNIIIYLILCSKVYTCF